MAELEKREKTVNTKERAYFDLEERSVIPQIDQEYIKILITEVDTKI